MWLMSWAAYRNVKERNLFIGSSQPVEDESLVRTADDKLVCAARRRKRITHFVNWEKLMVVVR